VTFVIADPCVGAKEHSCVAVCPVDCIHPTPDEPGFAESDQLYIDPEECIDCGACESECPVEAIFRSNELPDEWKRFLEVNAEHYKPAALG
jgi:NAD-dependent dihydropyrimidine dehydrogenase PreA subunit